MQALPVPPVVEPEADAAAEAPEVVAPEVVAADTEAAADAEAPEVVAAEVVAAEVVAAEADAVDASADAEDAAEVSSSSISGKLFDFMSILPTISRVPLKQCIDILVNSTPRKRLGLIKSNILVLLLTPEVGGPAIAKKIVEILNKILESSSYEQLLDIVKIIQVEIEIDGGSNRDEFIVKMNTSMEGMRDKMGLDVITLAQEQFKTVKIPDKLKPLFTYFTSPRVRLGGSKKLRKRKRTKRKSNKRKRTKRKSNKRKRTKRKSNKRTKRKSNKRKTKRKTKRNKRKSRNKI